MATRPEKEEMTIEEILAVQRGENLQEFREEVANRLRIRSIATNYMNSPPSQWPEININWDTSKDSQHFSLDGIDEDKFSNYYPNGFFLGYVDLAELDGILCHFSRRDEGELWKVGHPDRLAYLIVYLSEGKPISPPLVKPTEENEVIFNGGHHRYAVAKATGVKRIPIHVAPEYKAEIDTLLNIEWSSA